MLIKYKYGYLGSFKKWWILFFGIVVFCGVLFWLIKDKKMFILMIVLNRIYFVFFYFLGCYIMLIFYWLINEIVEGNWF